MTLENILMILLVFAGFLALGKLLYERKNKHSWALLNIPMVFFSWLQRCLSVWSIRHGKVQCCVGF